MDRERSTYIDILNILAIIAVISLHCNGIVHSYTNTRAWSTSLIVEVICFWAVPIFLMITGANLMNYRQRYDTITFFKKRFCRVLYPFVFWSIIMFLWKINTNQIVVDNFSIISLVDIFINNKVEPIYYYVFVILGIYMTMPLLSNLCKNEYRNSLWYTVIVYFIFNATLPAIFAIFSINYNWDLSIQIGGYIIFIILGYLLSTEEINKQKRLIVYCLAILGMILRYTFTYFKSVEAGYTVKVLFSYTQFHSILLAVSVFLLIKNINWNKFLKKSSINFLKKVSNCSFGIYLIHIFVMYYEQKLFNISIQSWQWRTLGVLITYIVSLTIVFILKRIPIINKLV